MDDKLKRYEKLDKLIEAGLENFNCKVDIQDKHIVCITLRVEDKEIKITK